MIEIYVDGELWADSDGVTAFEGAEASAIIGMLRGLGYDDIWTEEVSAAAGEA